MTTPQTTNTVIPPRPQPLDVLDMLAEMRMLLAIQRYKRRVQTGSLRLPMPTTNAGVRDD